MSELFEYEPEEDQKKKLEEQVTEVKEDTDYSMDVLQKELESMGGTLDEMVEDYEEIQLGETTPPQVTQEDIDRLFGDDWDGSFIDMTGIVENFAQRTASEMQLYSSVGEFLSSQQANIIDDLSRRTGLATVKSTVQQIQNNFTSLTNGISNFKTFGYTNGSTDMLYNADQVLSNVENMVQNSIQLQEYAEDIIGYIQNSPKMIEDVGSYMSSKIDQMTEIFAGENITNMLDAFPSQIAEKFMNMDIVQNLYTMPTRIFNSIQNLIASLNAIQAPTSLANTLVVIKQLKSVVSQMQNIQSEIQNAASTISNIKDNIANGNYIGVLQNAKAVSSFVEKPSSYAAKYPYNLAYETEGGHIFETDNTPGKERLHVQHVSGTDVEFTPSGDAVMKVKNEFQTVVDSNIDIHTKGKYNLIADNDAQIEANSINLVTKEGLNLSSDNSTINAGTCTFMADMFSAMSSKNMTLSSNLETSISSNGLLYLTSNLGIIIDAPLIQVGAKKATLINLNSNVSVLENSEVTHIISSPLIRAGGGLITLN